MNRLVPQVPMNLSTFDKKVKQNISEQFLNCVYYLFYVFTRPSPGILRLFPYKACNIDVRKY